MSSFRQRFQLFAILLLSGGAFGFSGTAARAETIFPHEPLLRLEVGQHRAMLRRISVERRQRFLLTDSDGKTVRVYEIKTRLLLKTLRIPLGEGNLGKVYSVAVSPDGETITVGGWTGGASNNYLYVLNRQTGEMIRRISGLPNVIIHLSYSPDGSSLGGANGIRIYETVNYQEIARDSDYGYSTLWIAFDKHNRLVTTSFDGHLQRYDANFNWIKKNRPLEEKDPFRPSFRPMAGESPSAMLTPPVSMSFRLRIFTSFFRQIRKALITGISAELRGLRTGRRSMPVASTMLMTGIPSSPGTRAGVA